MNLNNKVDADSKKSTAVEDASFTEKKPVLVFFFLLVAALIFGTFLFALVLYPSPHWVTNVLKKWNNPDHAAVSAVGGFLQGAWGTAGTLAASFVAIVLAQQALRLTRTQDRDQQEQHDKTVKLQREQNRILQQNTPEYQIAYAAAMSSTKLDSLQILIGSMERKKFRGTNLTLDDFVAVGEEVGSEGETKREIKSEVLSSRYIGFAARIAEQIYGTDKRLEIESLAAELILSRRPTIDKILINRLNETIHDLADVCMRDINKVLEHVKPPVAVQTETDPEPIIYRFNDYQHSKNLSKSTKVNKFKCVSKSDYYFVNMLSEHMRSAKYTYVEETPLKRLIKNKVFDTDIPFSYSDTFPESTSAFNQGLVVVTPFDFQRSVLIGQIKIFIKKNSNQNQGKLLESLKGEPDLKIMAAVNGDSAENPIVFLDQIESAQDSIQKNQYLTFSEHLELWEAMLNISRLLNKSPKSLQDFGFKVFTASVSRDLPNDLVGSQRHNWLIEKILPRYYQVSATEIPTELGMISNYELIIRQCLGMTEFNENDLLLSELNVFITELLEKLLAADFNPEKEAKEFKKFLGDFPRATAIVQMLAERPFFERPFYGWIIPDLNMTCRLETAESKPIGFIGVQYLLERNDGFFFSQNMLFRWLISPNTNSGPQVRSSVHIAI